MGEGPPPTQENGVKTRTIRHFPGGFRLSRPKMVPKISIVPRNNPRGGRGSANNGFEPIP